jgi:epoxyqueuosine reductase QueG
MTALRARIKALAGASAADMVGIAPGEAFTVEELGDLGRGFGPVRSVVVLAQHIVDPIQMVRFRSGETYQESRIATVFADAMLRDACWRVVELLREAGHRAAIPRNLRYGDSDPRHSISYKRAAVLAGFGAFGRNQLVIHPEWGPWLMLRTVITDAALPADERSAFSPCVGCGRCIEACPSGALLEAGIDRERCAVGESATPSATVLCLSARGGINCEECLRACPVGVAPPRMR